MTKIEIRSEEVRHTPNSGSAYNRLHAERTWDQIHSECGGIPINAKTLSDPATKDKVIEAAEERRKFVEEHEKINRRASGWPQF